MACFDSRLANEMGADADMGNHASGSFCPRNTGMPPAIRLLLQEQRLQGFTNPGEGGVEAVALKNDADLGLDRSRIAVTGEELVAGEAHFHLRIGFAVRAQDVTAHIEFEHRVADPRVFAEALGEIGRFGRGHEAILNGWRSTATLDVFHSPKPAGNKVDTPPPSR